MSNVDAFTEWAGPRKRRTFDIYDPRHRCAPAPSRDCRKCGAPLPAPAYEVVQGFKFAAPIKCEYCWVTP